MALGPADIAALSRLLDEALALDAADQEAWLGALPAEQQRHAQRLREMLAAQAGLATDERLDALPKLGRGDEDVAVARAGERVGAYSLIREIGRGGMGSVWLAERADGNYQRQIALKLPRLAWGAGLVERMARERKIGMLLEHPNIARLYDAGVDQRGRPFIAMEFIEGESIDAWCGQHQLGVVARLRLYVQVVRSVAYAHGRLVIHRDLKPANVLVDAQGQTRLLDFGIAKLIDAAADGANLTQDQGRVLTPHYASPEQVEGKPVGVAADVYSLGVMLYELLTGTLPLAPKRSSLGAIEDAILQGDAPPASSRVSDRATQRALRGDVDAILAMAMQREPERRYATADALAQDIERHLNGETVAARPDGAAYRLRKALRRHWLGLSAVAAVLVAVLTGSAVAVVQAQRAVRSAERERMVKEFVADVFRINTRVDPKNVAIRPPSPQSLLQGGAQLIQQRFAGQPEMQAELYGIVGGVFSDMGAYALASDYLTRRIEALALLRADRIEQAKALLALAQVLFDDQKFSDAETRILRARELSGGEPSVTLDAMLLLARLQEALDKQDAAETTLREAEAILDSQGANPSAARAWATFLRASLMVQDNELDKALPVYQQAVDMALLSEGRLSVTAIVMRLRAAFVLAQTRYTDQAQQQFDTAAAALRQLGGAHEVRASFETAKFAQVRFIGSNTPTPVSDAIANLEASRALLVATPLPIPDWWVPQIDFWLGTVKLGVGDIAGCLPLLEASVPILRKTFESPAEQAQLAGWMGAVLRVVGRHDLADRLLREMLELDRRTLVNHPYIVFSYIWVTNNLLMMGKTREAEALLDEAPHIAPMRGNGEDPDRYRLYLVHQRAKIRLLSGDATSALALLKSSTPSADPNSREIWDFNELLGEALCTANGRAEGFAILQRLVVEVQSGRFQHLPQAPWLARLRAVTGQCALALGDRKQARKLAELSRAAFAAQPGVSPYYKEPLFKLERALGLRLPPV